MIYGYKISILKIGNLIKMFYVQNIQLTKYIGITWLKRNEK